MKYFKIAVLIAGLFGLLWTAPAYAADDIWGACVDPVTNEKSTSPICAEKAAPDVIKAVVDTLLYLVGTLSIIFIIWSGFKYITSGGDPEKVKTAKNTLTYAVIGLIVSMLAFSIVNVVMNTTAPPENKGECMNIDNMATRKDCQIYYDDGGSGSYPGL